MTDLLHRILPNVQKPARYVGGEYNEIVKDKASVDTRVAFCFPDTYEIGMSNMGMRILYGLMNKMDGVWCERVFAPWGDMEDAMRKNGLPLYALERSPLASCVPSTSCTFMVISLVTRLSPERAEILTLPSA